MGKFNYGLDHSRDLGKKYKHERKATKKQKDYVKLLCKQLGIHRKQLKIKNTTEAYSDTINMLKKELYLQRKYGKPEEK